MSPMSCWPFKYSIILWWVSSKCIHAFCRQVRKCPQSAYMTIRIIIIIIIIIIERKDLGGVMSKDRKDTLQTLKTVTKRECDAKWEQSICQMRSWAELLRSGKLRLYSSVFSWRLKDASECNDVRDLDRLFYVRAAATGKARSPAVERRVGGTTSVDIDADVDDDASTFRQGASKLSAWPSFNPSHCAWPIADWWRRQVAASDRCVVIGRVFINLRMALHGC